MSLSRGGGFRLSVLFSFGAIQAAQLVLPLLALPWLARILGPEAFGLLMYMSIVSVIIGLVVDWGFPLGAVREAASCRENPSAAAALLGDVVSAKILSSAACVLLAAAALPLVPHAAEYPWAYVLAVAAGLARGINPTWFFQGIGQGMRRMAVWDAGSSALVLLLTVVLVRVPNDWPLYLALNAGCKAAAYLALTIGLWRRSGAAHTAVFSIARGMSALGRTRVLFAGTLAAVFYNNGAQLVLGAFLPPAQMGVLVACDKIVRAAVSLSNPVTQTLFPEICELRQVDKARAAVFLRRSLAGTAGLMLCATAALWFAAPLLIEMALGDGYAEAVPVLRVMAFLAPILACNFVLGTQTLVPFGREKALTLVQAVAAVFGLPAAALLAHFFGLWGGAFVSLLVEGGIFLGLIVCVLRLCPEAFFSPKAARSTV